MALTTQQFNQLKASLANKHKDMTEQGIKPETQKGFFHSFFEKTLPGVTDLIEGGPEQYIKNFNDPNSQQNINRREALKPENMAMGFGMTGMGTNLTKTIAGAGGKGALKTGEIALKGTQGAGNVLKGAGETSVGLVTKSSEPTKIALQAYQAEQPNLWSRVKNFITGNKGIGEKPITEANTATRLGLKGTEWEVGVQAKKIAGNLWNDVVLLKLKAAKVKVNMPEFLSNMEKEIKKTPELGRRNDLLEAFNAFKKDFKNVGSISLEKLQQYKEGWAKFVPEKSYKGKPIGTAFKDIQNQAASKARDIIYKFIGEDGKQAYFDYGNLKTIAESGIKSVEGLTDKGLSRKLYEAFIDKAVTPVATIGGQILYKTGEGLELIGKEGAKKIKDIIK